jgi:hypothetical protein
MNSELKRFIVETLRDELQELAVDPTRANANELALASFKDGDAQQFVLYNPKMVRTTYRMEKGYPIVIGFRSAVVGTIRIKQNCNSWMVSSVAAEKGYGPLMYDIAFSFAGNSGMLPDRSLVSPHARKIWKYIFDKRRNEFQIKPVPTSCKFADKNKLGKEPYLDFIYVLNTPVQGLESLQQRNKAFLEELSSEMNYDVKKLLAMMASDFFSRKMISEGVNPDFLEEEAVSSAKALEQGLALYHLEEGGFTTLVLYDPKLYNTGQMVVGMIEITRMFNCKSWRIGTSSAIKGYGPLLYDIAFSIAGRTGLMADRTRVSDSAKRVWNYIFQYRKDEFEAIPLEAACRFKGDKPEEALNYKFILKTPLSISQFTKPHQDFLASFRSSDEKKEFLQELEDQANDFFNKRYFGT